MGEEVRREGSSPVGKEVSLPVGHESSDGTGLRRTGSKPRRGVQRLSTVQLSKRIKDKAKAAKAKARVLADMKPKRKKKQVDEPLLEMTAYEKCAIALNEAIHQRCYAEYPGYRQAWFSYVSYQKQDGFLQSAVFGLLLLTLFETPLWCNVEGKWFWTWESAQERCTAAHGLEKHEIIMSGAMMLPSGIGAIVEYTLLIALMLRLILKWRVEYDFQDCAPNTNPNDIYVSFALVSVGLADASYYWLHPGTNFRLAPYVRFGLAASVPWVRDLLFSFWRVLVAISKAFAFLMGTVMGFAWLLAMTFDDLTASDRYGQPVNQGFESFGNALYSSFATMTTSITPDIMIPSYVYSRNFVWVWLPFLLLATVIFNNVLLAAVYSEYQSQYTMRVKAAIDRRHFSVRAAFEIIKERRPEGEFRVSFQTFQEVCEMLRSFQPISADENLIRLIYEALDTNNDGTLSEGEFFVMCDVLETSFTTTRRDSWFRMKYQHSSAGKRLHSLLDNGKEGLDYGYQDRYSGSVFDNIMSSVLFLNVVWMAVQSGVDLNDVPEPGFFDNIDVFFSLIYLLEVGFKLLWWSWGEYWVYRDNKFDFVTTLILASSAFGYLFFQVDKAILRYLNLLRLVRLLKALNNIAAYREVWSVVERMVRSCSDVMIMNFLVIYLWSAAGTQLFGGRLLQSNPRLMNQDFAYFDSHYESLNFNDVFMGMVTLFFFTLGTWIDPLANVCFALADIFTLEWFLIYGHLLTFYVASPLLAFNVFTSFSIDVFCNLQDMDAADGAQQNQVMRNVADVRDRMAAEGFCLHVAETAALSRTKVMRKMFAEG